jgi:hypothetical protein
MLEEITDKSWDAYTCAIQTYPISMIFVGLLLICIVCSFIWAIITNVIKPIQRIYKAGEYWKFAGIMLLITSFSGILLLALGPFVLGTFGTFLIPFHAMYYVINPITQESPKPPPLATSPKPPPVTSPKPPPVTLPTPPPPATSPKPPPPTTSSKPPPVTSP